MRYYYITYVKNGKIIRTPAMNKKSCVRDYILILESRDLEISELTMWKVDNNKEIDYTQIVNKFLYR